MAELGFMESLALGMIAGRSGNQFGEAGVGIFSDLRHKQQVAQADATYAALVDEYNHVVDRHDAVVERFWRVHGHYEAWREEAEKRKERIDALLQELAAANQRVATSEQWGNALAVREAEARRDAEYYKASRDRISNMATQDAMKLFEAQAEIARLQAIIAGMAQAPQDPPPSGASAP
jgi:hypothetical protein